MEEIWKDIKGYEGLYAVSNTGRVKRLTCLNYSGNKIKERILKVDKSMLPYCRVTLCKLGKTERYFIHRLVAMHFIKQEPGKDLVNHKDNDPTNNHVDNLEWCTHSENMIHAQRQGRLTAAQRKGGINSSIIARDKAINKYTQEIGKIYGKRLVLGISKDTYKNGKILLTTKCLNCESTANATLYDLKRRLPTKCSTCRAKI